MEDLISNQCDTGGKHEFLEIDQIGIHTISRFTLDIGNGPRSYKCKKCNQAQIFEIKASERSKI